MRFMRTAEDDGFTLIEVVVSIALFAILSASVGLILTGNIRSSRLTQQRVAAANVAQSLLAAIKPGGTFPASLPATVNGYVVRVNANPATSTCTVGTTRAVSIVVYAPNSSGSGTPLARSDSVVAC